MTNINANTIDSTVNVIANAIQNKSSDDMLWQIMGTPSGGKSTVLSKLYARLQAEGWQPIIVEPPREAHDAGSYALIQIGAGLKNYGVIDGQLDNLANPSKPWKDKLKKVYQWVTQPAAEPVVLLCDEPSTWLPRSDNGAYFVKHSQDVVNTIFRVNQCPSVFTGDLPDNVVMWRTPEQYRLEQIAIAQWFADAKTWGPLVTVATELSQYLLTQLTNYNPLEWRLLIAQAALTSVDEVRQWLPKLNHRNQIIQKFKDLLEKEWTPLKECWAKLALVRCPFPQTLLDIDILGATDLDKQLNTILRHCLLYQRKEGCELILPEKLRDNAKAWLDENITPDIHARLAEFYAKQFEQKNNANDATALSDEMEAFYHATASCQAILMEQFRPFFVDQLDERGRVLSCAKKYPEAVKVFERAIKWDKNDDYAHHYLAYNLDIQGIEASRVDEHYYRAIELNPQNVWWHSRWLCFLITRGRSKPAHKAWDDALEILRFETKDYEHFHLWVARLLVHRGQLDFAGQVLDNIPQSVRQKSLGIRAIERRLSALIKAQKNGSVFPLSIPTERSWNGGPHLSARQLLVHWLPGQIEEISDDNIYLLVAKKSSSNADDVQYGRMTITAEQFDKWSQDERFSELRAGRFVELAFYEGEDKPVIRVYHDIAWDDADLPPLFPEPQRYLRQGGWVQ